ncbi:hypothetical protein C8R45DRAFT_1077514 [Mycena sanguinolenta]|nr:hypothetical protein C8R45DRAFT_1077514 [Mycena sanguinolenta]
MWLSHLCQPGSDFTLQLGLFLCAACRRGKTHQVRISQVLRYLCTVRSRGAFSSTRALVISDFAYLPSHSTSLGTSGAHAPSPPANPVLAKENGAQPIRGRDPRFGCI